MSDLASRRRGEPVGPPVNRLVARRHDLDAAQRALSDSRLVTFTGHGGVGKTRLAMEMAYRARDRFPDGVWLVCLADLSIGAEVAEVESAIISALGISDQSASRPREKLLSFLGDRKLLLLLDNCEHVLSSVRASLPVMLKEAPNLRVVATSREPLGCGGEKLRPVPPLSVPEPGIPAEQLIADGSVSLLVERAYAVDPDFELTDDNAAAVVELCRLLEGLPLAIELAAAKLRALTVEQVVKRFGQQLTSLTAAGTPSASRHRSLRSMVDWSYELCPKTAQVLWRRLSAFPGTFDLELAESVCSFGELCPDDVLDAIERLVAQSILSTSRTAGTMRYRLPAAIREVAADLAEQAGEVAELQRRHRDAMLWRAQETLRQWCGPRQHVLVEQMSLDHASYVAALQWSINTAGEQQTALMLVASLRYHYLVGGRLAEGRMRIEAALAAVAESSPMRAECLWVVTWVALLQGDHQRAEQSLSELSVVAGELDDLELVAHLHHWDGLLKMFRGNLDGAVRDFQVALDGHRSHGNRYLELTARYMLACALAAGGDAQPALQMSTETAELCEQYGERNARAYTDWAAGLAYWTLGHLDEAERSTHQVLMTQRTLGDGIGAALAINLCSWIAYDRGQLGRAAELSLAAAHVWRSLGTSLEAFGPQLSAFAEGHSPPKFGPPQTDQDPIRQRFHNLDEVIDFVLGVGAGRAGADRVDSAPLTKRELEVAALIENGLSNREIAERLVIAKRTADGHVERILAKLGFSSRAQIAAWMARRAS
ncbi:ATP-binding protein [Mycobacterium colombiense]|uniref:ATP-binding protein n=1 Tax=Mycobacterium colombiense TaxID=339268 RepID=UPI0007ED02D8|nr:LuxR C-terminal-related transcriptional regulator [Mycobacterium colombiense]OBJ26728.1 LuxR family transcriptional regulator [Mycobacterium colombiense]